MQTFKLWCICFIVLSFSCKNKPEPEPSATASINDILGTWLSIDSMIVKKDNKFVYSHDVFFVGKDTLLRGFNYSIYVERNFSVYLDSFGGYAFYSAKYFGLDSLILSYTGPSFVQTPDYKHKVYFNTSKDTLTIFDLRTTYPAKPFYKFYKK